MWNQHTATWVPFFFYLPALWFGWRGGWVQVVSGAVVVVALALLTWSRFSLGSSFSANPEARRLITNGPYRFVRHPIYTFSALALAALLVYLNWWWAGVPFGYLIRDQMNRAKAESFLLELVFKDEWRAWRRGTWI